MSGIYRFAHFFQKMACSEGRRDLIDVFPTLTSPFGNQPEALQKDPATWKETLKPLLESYLHIQIPDDRVFALQAPQLDARRSEDHLKRCVDCAQIQKHLSKDFPWKKVVKTLKREPTSAKKNTSIRHFYKAEGHMFLVKFGFTFGLRKVEPGTQHVYQTSQVSLMCFHLPKKNEGYVNLTRRIFLASDQKYFLPHVFRPHTNYIVPAGTYYLILAVQKTLFSVQVLSDAIQLSATKYLSFTSHKERENMYIIPPPTPRHLGCADEWVTQSSGVREPPPSSSSSLSSNKKRKHNWNEYVIPKKKTVTPNVSHDRMCESLFTDTTTNPEMWNSTASHSNTMQQYVDSAELQEMFRDCSSADGKAATQTISIMDIAMNSPSVGCLQNENFDTLYMQQQNNYELLSLKDREDLVQTFSVDFLSSMEPSVETLTPPTTSEKSSYPFETNFVTTTPWTMKPQLLVPPTLVSHSQDDRNPSSTNTKKSSWPFKTQFVTCPWSMKPQLLVPPVLCSQSQDTIPSKAHACETSHKDHIQHILGGVYKIKNGTKDFEKPSDLRLK